MLVACAVCRCSLSLASASAFAFALALAYAFSYGYFLEHAVWGPTLKLFLSEVPLDLMSGFRFLCDCLGGRCVPATGPLLVRYVVVGPCSHSCQLA